MNLARVPRLAPWALFWLTACASHGRGGAVASGGRRGEHVAAGAASTPAAAAPASPAPSGARPPSPRPAGDFVPALPAAERYQGGATLTSPGPAEDALARALREELPAALGQGGARALPDARLDRVAHEFAVLGDAATLPVQQFVLAHHGVVEPDLGLQVFRMTERSEAEVVRRVVEAVRTARGLATPRAFGVAWARADDELRVAVATLDHVLQLEPVSRRLPADGQVTLSARLRAGLGQPEAVVQTPGGRLGRVPVRRARPRAGAEGAFTVDFRCADGPGPYQVELLATGPEGIVVVANFPLYCGVAPPGRIGWPAHAAGERVEDPARLEAELLELCQQARRAAGLPALTLDAALAEVARAHSREMARAGQVAHRLPHTGVAPDRLQAAGIRARVVLENVGGQAAYSDDGARPARGRGVQGGASARELHEGFMSSPGHRAGILSPLVTHVGVGVVRDVQGGAPAYYVTQLFVAY